MKLGRAAGFAFIIGLTGCLDNFDHFIVCTRDRIGDPRCPPDGGGGAGRSNIDAAPCGMVNSACCSTDPACAPGAICNAGLHTCVECGMPGEQCCVGANCDNSLAVCSGTVCIAKNVWAVDYHGHVTQWDGARWSAATLLTSSAGSLRGLGGSSAADVRAAGYDYPAGSSQPPQGVVYRFDGNGWGPSYVSALRDIEDVWVVNSADVWMVGSDAQGGAAAHAGTGSATGASFGSGILFGVWGGGADDIWAVGQAVGQGAAFHWTSATMLSSPAIQPIAETGGLIAVWGSGAGDVWAVGYDTASAAVLVYWPNGFASTPTTFTLTPSNILRTIWGSGSRDVWAAGDGGVVLHWDQGPNSAPTPFPTGNATVGIENIWGSGPNDAWAVGGSVAFHFTGNGWTSAMNLPGIQEASAVWGVAR